MQLLTAYLLGVVSVLLYQVHLLNSFFGELLMFFEGLVPDSLL